MCCVHTYMPTCYFYMSNQWRWHIYTYCHLSIASHIHRYASQHIYINNTVMPCTTVAYNLCIYMWTWQCPDTHSRYTGIISYTRILLEMATDSLWLWWLCSEGRLPGLAAAAPPSAHPLPPHLQTDRGEWTHTCMMYTVDTITHFSLTVLS